MCFPGTLLASSWSRPCFSVTPPSLCLSDSLLELSGCDCLVTCSLVSAHLQQLDLSVPLGTWLRLLALQSSSSILNFLEGQSSPARLSHSPLVQSAVARGWGPLTLGRGLRTGSLRRWDSSAGGPLGMDPQVPHSFAPGLPPSLSSLNVLNVKLPPPQAA